MFEIDFAQQEQQEQQQRQQQKAEKAAITITYELPKLNEKLANGQSVSMSIDVSFNVNVHPSQF